MHYSYNDNGDIAAFDAHALDADDTLLAYGNYSYDSVGCLQSFGNETFAYDAVGNPTTYRGQTAEWTRGRSLIRLGNTTFTYDASGKRLSKNTTQYVYDSQGTLLCQSDGLSFHYDAMGLVRLSDNGTDYYYRKDLQGNIVALLDNSGNIVVEYVYDAWGNHKALGADGAEITDPAHIGNRNPFRYCSYYYDVETGLYYLSSRYYDPELRRFINADSIAYADPETIGGLNLYAYCLNNPVMYTDPTGTKAWRKLKRFFIKAGKVVGGGIMAIIGANTLVHLLPFALAFNDGFLTQCAFSIMMYGGYMAASAFDSQINADMGAIHWNPFNRNTDPVLESGKVSFYKGIPVIRTNLENSSGTFYAIFLEHHTDTNTLRHEWGHTIQQGITGPVRFGLTIAICSPLTLGNDKWPEETNYEDKPWELTADIFGGADREHSTKDTATAWLYLALAATPLSLLSYLVLL